MSTHSEMSKQFYFKQISLASVRSLNFKTVLLQVIQFTICSHFFSIWPIDGSISVATTPGQSGSGNHGKEGVLHIPQSSSITVTSPSDCLMSYPGHTSGAVLPLCRDAVSLFYTLSRQANNLTFEWNWKSLFKEHYVWVI